VSNNWTLWEVKQDDGNKYNSVQKISISVNATEIPSSEKEKYEGSGSVGIKNGGAGGEIHQKGRSQKETETEAKTGMRVPEKHLKREEWYA